MTKKHVLTGLLMLSASPLLSANADLDGATVYQRFCATCHQDVTFIAGRDAAELHYRLRFGVPGTAMAGWEGRLSQGEMIAVLEWMKKRAVARPVSLAEAHGGHAPADIATPAVPAAPMQAAIEPEPAPLSSPAATDATTPQAVPLSDQPQTEPLAVVNGEAIYRKNCAVCHGDTGSSARWTANSLNPAPRDFTSPQSRRELTRERMLTSATYGRPGTAMMSFRKRLSTAEIAAVVDFIRARFMRHEQPATSSNDIVQSLLAVEMQRPFPSSLHGDINRGERIYQNNCFTCHGRQGDGKGPRYASIYPPPRNFLAPAARQRLNRPTLFRSIREGLAGSVMPAWSKVLSDQQIADVGEYVFQHFLHPLEEKKSALRKALPASVPTP